MPYPCRPGQRRGGCRAQRRGEEGMRRAKKMRQHVEKREGICRTKKLVVLAGVAMSLPRDKPSREAREAQRRRPPPSSARANRRAGAATAAAIVDDHLRVGGAPTEASPEQRDDVHVLALAERHRRVVAPSRRKPARLATRGRPQASEADSPATATRRRSLQSP